MKADTLKMVGWPFDAPGELSFGFGELGELRMGLLSLDCGESAFVPRNGFQSPAVIALQTTSESPGSIFSAT